MSNYLLHSASLKKWKTSEHYVHNEKINYSSSQVQAGLQRVLVIHIGFSSNFEVTPSQFMIYSIVLPNTGCSVFIKTSCSSSYPQRSLKFNILEVVLLVEHVVRKCISFFFLLILSFCAMNLIVS